MRGNMKICKDCKHFYDNPSAISSTCKKGKIDIVTGEPMTKAENMRLDLKSFDGITNLCGTSGKLYEALSMWDKILKYTKDNAVGLYFLGLGTVLLFLLILVLSSKS